MSDDTPFLAPGWLIDAVGGTGGVSEAPGIAGTRGRLSGWSEGGLAQLGTNNAGLGEVL